MNPSLDAAPLEDAGEAVAEAEVCGGDGAAEGELEEGVLLLLVLVAEGAADPEGATAAVVDEVTVSVPPASQVGRESFINFGPHLVV